MGNKLKLDVQNPSKGLGIEPEVLALMQQLAEYTPPSGSYDDVNYGNELATSGNSANVVKGGKNGYIGANIGTGSRGSQINPRVNALFGGVNAGNGVSFSGGYSPADRGYNVNIQKRF